MSIEKELRRRQQLVAGAQIELRHQAQQKEARRLMAATKAPVTPPNGVSNDFAELLKKTAQRVKADKEIHIRSDLPEVLAKLRKEGKLALPGGHEVEHLPTPEQVLECLGPKNHPDRKPNEVEVLPSPEEVLNGPSVQALAPAEPMRHTAFKSKKKY
jgi:hypothetical protein